MATEKYVVILDCYTDEPSGYGVRPYLGTHQIHLSQALSSKGITQYYMTIEDLRHCAHGDMSTPENTDIHTLYRTHNAERAFDLIHGATTIYLIMGCFVDYQYFACVPPRSKEVFEFLKDTPAEIILFYVLGASESISTDYVASELSNKVDKVVIGNTYRYVLEPHSLEYLKPNYDLLDQISDCPIQIVGQLLHPIIAEIECGTGCNTPTCTFCIEANRPVKVSYRSPQSIIKQIKTLYDVGVRHFRLGRQPNFFHYQNQNLVQVESLLAGIREQCPDLKMLHIDNVNIINVISKRGIQIAKLVSRYCTSGNITPFGIESFDNQVREQTKVIGSADNVLRAIEIINEYGKARGNDGLPTLLPGINLIYGLPGQTSDTHKINLDYLHRILDSGLQSRRLYFRKMTSHSGVSMSNTQVDTHQEYMSWFDDIIDQYVLPMQSKVYPEGTIVKDNCEVIVKDGDSYLRTLGTCPIRIVVKDRILKPFQSYDIRVRGNLGYRRLLGEVV